MKRILPLAVGLAVVAIAGVQSYAFMAASDEAAVEAQLNVDELVENVRENMDDENIDCNAKFAIIGEAIDQIDAVLDAGSSDEDTLLDTRDALVQLRLELPCQADTQLAGNQNNCDCNQHGYTSGGHGSGGYTSGGYSSGGYAGGGRVSGGVRGAASRAAGGNAGRIALLAAGAAAIAIPIATSDDDDAPAPAASASANN